MKNMQYVLPCIVTLMVAIGGSVVTSIQGRAGLEVRIENIESVLESYNDTRLNVALLKQDGKHLEKAMGDYDAAIRELHRDVGELKEGSKVVVALLEVIKENQKAFMVDVKNLRNTGRLEETNKE